MGAVVQQVQPVNVNISIRVDSPGDNGAVTQINAAIADVTAAITTVMAPEPQYQPAEQQYQAPEAQAAPAAPAPAPAAPASPAPTAPAPAEQWDWTWQWSCGEAISPDIVLPGTSTLAIWNWNWDWNCGGEPATGANSDSQLPTQYHASASQYQPINVNISIRIMSPGNDGAVSQTNIAKSNLAVSVASFSPIRSLPVVLPVPVVLPPSSPAASSAPGSGGAPASGAAPVESPGLAGAIVEFAAEIVALPFGLVVELGCCSTIATAGDIAGREEGATARRANPARPDLTAGEAQVGPTAQTGRRDTTASAAAIAAPAPVSAEAVAALAAPRPAVEAARHAKAQEQLKQGAVAEDRAGARAGASGSPTPGSRRSAPPTTASRSLSSSCSRSSSHSSMPLDGSGTSTRLRPPSPAAQKAAPASDPCSHRP